MGAHNFKAEYTVTNESVKKEIKNDIINYFVKHFGGNIAFNCVSSSEYEYNSFCKEIIELACPSMYDISLIPSQSYFNTFNHVATCYYSYTVSNMTDPARTTKDCEDIFGSSFMYCQRIIPNVCTYGPNLALTACQEYCSKNYCPQVYTYCTGDKLNNPTCQFYVTNKSTQIYDFSTQATSYCTGNNLDTDICKQYCFGNNAASTRIDCTKELESYCSDLSVGSSVCDCYRPESYYKSILEKHFDKVTDPTLRETFIEEFLAAPKYCSSFFGCSTSNYKPKNATTCSLDTSVCIANTNFTNIGVFDVTCPANINTGCVNFKTQCTSTINNYLKSSAVKKPSVTPSPSVTPTPQVTHPQSTEVTKPVTSKPNYKLYVILGVGILLLIIVIVVVVIVIKKHKNNA